MHICYACGAHLSFIKMNDYIQCPECRSFTFVSDRSAEVENKEYFDNFFKTLEGRKNDSMKERLYARYESVDHALRKKEYSEYQEKRQQIMQHLNGSARVLEIGFGSGEHLYNLLQKKIEAYGVDISVTAVANFQNKHPEYAERVQCGARLNKKIDVVYCCALFEHLDKPTEFIWDAANRLEQGGLLIIDGLPLLNEFSAHFNMNEDISFWKPCHRAIYSVGGLRALFSQGEFALDVYARHDDYNYRVLSLHIKHGYEKISELRASCVTHKELPGLYAYYRICKEALRVNSLVYNACLMFRKN
jgi:SAM-dependent methyltransferase